MVNLCSSNRLSSVCSAENWDLQKDCQFAEKSNFRNACIHYFTDDHRCDNYKAQNNKRGDKDLLK